MPFIEGKIKSFTSTPLPPHPAKFSDSILETLAVLVANEMKDRGGRSLLDPFAGTGRIHELRAVVPGLRTYGIEIEPEWAKYSQYTSVGNALDLPPNWTSFFDIVATSPTYGNRMADSHNAKDASVRITYKHKLGRDPHPKSSGTLHFGPKYQEFHEQAWSEVYRVLRPGGMFIMNISDFIRKGERVDVTGWHINTVSRLGFSLEREIPVATPRMGFGANGKSRVDSEKVLVFRRRG